MALIDFETLKLPITAEAPCGPDFDALGDSGYMNLMARIEGLMPESFFSFDRTALDFKAETEALSRLLDETRDLRVLAFLAKLLVLDRNLHDFTRCVSAIADLLEDQWSGVHPTLEDADAGMRSAVLKTLDDMPNVILPLQYMPLAKGRRSGAVSYRTHMIVTGEVARREQDPPLDATVLDQTLMECDLPSLIETRDHAARLLAAVRRIQSTWIEHAGFADSPGLDLLTPLSEKIITFLDGAVARRDPAAALKGAEAADDSAGDDDDEAAHADTAAPGARPQIRSTAGASAMLAGAARFLERHEPSNPALLLVRQAEQLVGKSFVEIMAIIVPDSIGNAQINVGHDQSVGFPIERLLSLMQGLENSADESDSSEPAAAEPPIEITSRLDAMMGLDQVATFYRATEPSSPIPLLMERARSFASRDFMSLLREIAPPRD